MIDILALFPWAAPLPAAEREEFAAEFIAAAASGASLDEVVGAWRATAEIYADPKLKEELSRDLPGTTRRVPRP